MSLHANSPEATKAMRRSQKMQAASSAAIAFLFITLIMLILSLFLLQPNFKEVPVIVSYEYEQKEQKDERKTHKETIKKKPSAPSSSVAKVIASTAVANVAIPVPEVEVTAIDSDFGMDGDFGSGWGGGSGSGSGSASFFNTKTKADRVAYVIDYSASMKGQKDQLMRTELARSVGELKGQLDYQLIFFAGPAWVAGDQVKLNKGGISKVISNGKTYEWKSGGGAHSFSVKDENKAQVAKWLKPQSSQIKKSMKLIEETKLVWGTTWKPAIDMALRMNPKPNVIFFMTDGSCGGNMVQLGEEIGKKAKKKGVIINTVAMMDPKTKEAMLKMAEESGGSYTMIGKDGKPYDKNGKPIKMKK